MNLYFITWDEMTSALRPALGYDLCQADTDKQAVEKEMGKNSSLKKNTSNYKCYNLQELLDKYSIKIVDSRKAEDFKPLIKAEKPKANPLVDRDIQVDETKEVKF